MFATIDGTIFAPQRFYNQILLPRRDEKIFSKRVRSLYNLPQQLLRGNVTLHPIFAIERFNNFGCLPRSSVKKFLGGLMF